LAVAAGWNQFALSPPRWPKWTAETAAIRQFHADVPLISDSHVYVFVNLNGAKLPNYLAVRSAYVAEHMKIKTRKTGSTWYSFKRQDRLLSNEGWELFDDP
jgi:hypothetical protein